MNGGTENDLVSADDIGSMLLWGGDGADTLYAGSAHSPQTIVGGNDSNDGPDRIEGGVGGDVMFGNGGNDTIADGSHESNDTFVGGFGHDSIVDFGAVNLIFVNQGNDTIVAAIGGMLGVSTILGGLGDATMVTQQVGQIFGNEGNDTIDAHETDFAITVVGGNNSADGDDLIESGFGVDLAFGNGGDDTLLAAYGDDTVVAGAGDDLASLDSGNNLAFGNEGNDTLFSAVPGQSTVFGGMGDNSIRMNGSPGANRDLLQGNEGNDTIRGRRDVDTISGGSGSDVFAYSQAEDDGDNAAGGGPVELITDVDFAVDRFDSNNPVTFAANVGAGTGQSLALSANNAIAAVFALAGGGSAIVAAQFTFAGRTYLAIDQVGFGAFADDNDLLLDITGATGSIAASNFI